MDALAWPTTNDSQTVRCPDTGETSAVNTQRISDPVHTDGGDRRPRQRRRSAGRTGLAVENADVCVARKVTDCDFKGEGATINTRSVRGARTEQGRAKGELRG